MCLGSAGAGTQSRSAALRWETVLQHGEQVACLHGLSRDSQYSQ
jgi:hypothetical protein